jgi:hypothetical protein
VCGRSYQKYKYSPYILVDPGVRALLQPRMLTLPCVTQVLLVRHGGTGQSYALKCQPKKRIVEAGLQEHLVSQSVSQSVRLELGISDWVLHTVGLARR